MNLDGVCVVLSAGRTYGATAENRLDGCFIATTAIAGRRFYLRSKERVFAVKRR